MSQLKLQLFCTILYLVFGVFFGQAATAKTGAQNQIVRVGVLQFGTVRWELDVIERYGLAERYQLDIQVTPLASTQATLTALQSGAVDVIVGDWIWAARQRQFNRAYAFYPYSSSAASVMVDPKSGIHSLADLRGKKVGVAGGPVNKSWILYKAYARKAHQLDLARDANIKFAAPPILNELLVKGELDAVINFWHFSARLEDRGYQQLMAMEDVLTEFSIDGFVPVLGWLFKQSWADDKTDTLNRFLAASYHARGILLNSDNEWALLQPLVAIESQSLKQRLRDRYRLGIPRRFGMAEIDSTRQLSRVLKAEAGSELSGPLHHLPDDLFWPSTALPLQ